MLQLSTPTGLRQCPIPLLHHKEAPHAERRIARGLLVRVRPGVYADAAEWQALAAWNRYLARVHALILIHPDVVLCLESAAALLGMPIFGDPVTVHVLAGSTSSSRLTAGIRSHKGGLDRELTHVGGVSLTSISETAVDLARRRHKAVGLAAADSALRLDGGITSESLLRINEGRASSRGRNIARWSLSRSTALAESAFESINRAVFEWLGFPPPHLQVTYRSSSGIEDRVDYVWRDVRLGGESDGDLKLDGRFGDARELLRQRSLRDQRLREHLRAVAHWGWAETTTVTPLRSILLGAGLRAIAPENSFELHSLTRLLGPRAAATPR